MNTERTVNQLITEAFKTLNEFFGEPRYNKGQKIKYKLPNSGHHTQGKEYLVYQVDPDTIWVTSNQTIPTCISFNKKEFKEAFDIMG